MVVALLPKKLAPKEVAALADMAQASHAAPDSNSIRFVFIFVLLIEKQNASKRISLYSLELGALSHGPVGVSNVFEKNFKNNRLSAPLGNDSCCIGRHQKVSSDRPQPV